MEFCGWLEQNEADVPPGEDWLHENEQIRVSGFRVSKRRKEWLLGRWTAKKAIAAFLNLPIEADHLSIFEIGSAALGAPQVFVDDRRLGLSISITHREGFAACAIAKGEVALGCDLELIEMRSENFIADYFTSDEQALLACEPESQRAMLATLIWSAKESALKVLKQGLRLPTQSVNVCPTVSAPTAWLPLQVECKGGQAVQGWWQPSGRLVRTVASSAHLDQPTFLGHSHSHTGLDSVIRDHSRNAVSICRGGGAL